MMNEGGASPLWTVPSRAGVLGPIRKQVVQAVEVKPVNRTPPQLLLRLLPWLPSWWTIACESKKPAVPGAAFGQGVFHSNRKQTKAEASLTCWVFCIFVVAVQKWIVGSFALQCTIGSFAEGRDMGNNSIEVLISSLLFCTSPRRVVPSSSLVLLWL